LSRYSNKVNQLVYKHVGTIINLTKSDFTMTDLAPHHGGKTAGSLA